jgi:hypothetical protein
LGADEVPGRGTGLLVDTTSGVEVLLRDEALQLLALQHHEASCLDECRGEHLGERPGELGRRRQRDRLGGCNAAALRCGALRLQDAERGSGEIHDSEPELPDFRCHSDALSLRGGRDRSHREADRDET